MADFLTVLSEYDIAGAYWVNLKLTFFAGLFALVLGTILAMFRISPIPSLNLAGTAYVNILRNTPLTIIIVFGLAVLWPVLRVEFSEVFTVNFFWLGVVGLTVYHAAFFCEALRSGINTVPVGQAEAARAIGLPFLDSARLVIFPQAFRGAIAPLGNVVIALIKNTTVVAAGSVSEIATLMREMIENESNYVYPIFLTVAVGFVIIVVPVGMLATYLSRRLAVSR
ncbi:amino acid ABC transporter permease [Pseudactinotalea suaedae]|uniref:amino acid ABC transporter permease n=1 Tax=Pseudactinotalea suaedae TaxID=1524924 RepID=UPI0012E1E379|nr:amino acid ABC transporter permease [Pseudactinotalea suaedae]